MNNLPEEMVFLIGQYLTDKDLSACCAVSHGWRYIFNQDVVWKNRCDPDLVQYLRETKCFVEPFFVSPELPDSGLSDVCEWRLNYMRQNHVLNNWRQCRFHTFQIPTNLDAHHVSQIMFYGSDMVILYGFRNNRTHVQLWKVTSDPVFLSDYMVPTVDIRISVNVTENLVFISLGEVVEVLSVTNLLQLQFEHAFYFTQSTKIPFPVLENLIGSSEDIGRHYVTVVGPKLVAISKLPVLNKTMHVWNLETGEKVKEEVYEDCTFVAVYRTGEPIGNRAIVCVRQSNVVALKVLIYDLTQYAFHPFFVNSYGLPIACLLHKEFFAINMCKILCIYNIETKQLVYHTPADVTQVNIFNTFRNQIVFNHGNTLKVFNYFNSEVRILFTLQEAGFVIRLESVLRDKLILFYVIPSVYTSNYPILNPHFLEDKHINVKRALPLPLVNDYFVTNATCSKFLFSPHLKEYYVVLNFW